MDNNTKLMDIVINKLNALDENISSIDKTLARNTVSLEEHIKRTNLLEKKLEPVEAHVNKVNGAFILIGILSTVLGILKILGII